MARVAIRKKSGNARVTTEATATTPRKETVAFAKDDEFDASPVSTPRKRGRLPRDLNGNDAGAADAPVASTLTSKRRRTDAFLTPTKAVKGFGVSEDTPTRRTLADRSARRKSTRALIDRMVAEDEDEDEDEDNGGALGRAILDEEEEEDDKYDDDEDDQELKREKKDPRDVAELDLAKGVPSPATALVVLDEDTPVTPTAQKRGRGQASKKQHTPVPVDENAAVDGHLPKRRRGQLRKDTSTAVREPSPPRELPAYEQYFFQNRAGAAAKTSNNTLAALRLLTHEEYFQQVQQQQKRPRHEREMAYLETLHAQSFAQWAFELSQGFGVCLYGYGTKQHVLRAFAKALYRGIRDHDKNRIVMATAAAATAGGGGVATALTAAATLRDILLVVAAAATTKATSVVQLPRLPTGAAAAERALLHLLDGATATVTLILDGIDAPALRRAGAQATLARVAGHSRVRLLCAADTPSFPLLWDGAARSQLNLVFHDTTTFRPLWHVSGETTEGETARTVSTMTTTGLDPVDDVHALLGRRARRVGGKDGAAFVLRSLPENARQLFQLLVGEMLAAAGESGGDGGGGSGGRRRQQRKAYDDDYADDDDDDDDDGDDNGDYGDNGALETIGLEHRMIYNKAVEEFICSSEMSFRTLLKEFHDHQMVTSRKDAFGTELLSLPFRRDELEALLEELAL